MNIPDSLKKLAVPVDSLRHYSRNPRSGNVDVIKESLAVNGQYRPIVVNERTGEVLAGNHTLKAAKMLGWKEIAATFVDVDDEEAARIVLVDNRSNDVAGYDEEALLEMLQELPSFDGTGFSELDVDELLAQLSVGFRQKDKEATPELPENPKTKLGDLYIMGKHRLLCGDATNTLAVDFLMDGAKAAMVFTDPPYGVDYDGGTKVREKLEGDHSTAIYYPAMEQIARIAEKKAPLYLWHAYTKADAVLDAVRTNGFEVRSLILWNKNQAQFGALSAHYKQKHEPCVYCCRVNSAPHWYGPTNEVSVWEADRAKANDYHPTQKPVALAERALENSSRPGDIIVDLFGGSGSTIVACEGMKRRCYTMELDPGYCDVIVERWETLTGGKATLVEG